MTGDREMCYCGRPLHYVSLLAERSVRRLIELHGANILVTTPDGTFNVPRHFIALHGLIATEVADLGFERVE